MVKYHNCHKTCAHTAARRDIMHERVHMWRGGGGGGSAYSESAAGTSVPAEVVHEAVALGADGRRAALARPVDGAAVLSGGAAGGAAGGGRRAAGGASCSGRPPCCAHAPGNAAPRSAAPRPRRCSRARRVPAAFGRGGGGGASPRPGTRSQCGTAVRWPPVPAAAAGAATAAPRCGALCGVAMAASSPAGSVGQSGLS